MVFGTDGRATKKFTNPNFSPALPIILKGLLKTEPFFEALINMYKVMIV